MLNVAIEALFLGSGSERRFAVLTAPRSGNPRGALLFVPAFAEEMNKARRMVALTAQALAAMGYASLRIDLHGCGDSAGDFADATWSGWVADVTMAHRWLRQRTETPVSVCTLRAGALLTAAALPGLTDVPQVVFWQPVLSGSPFLRQFLRLKTASSLLAGESGANSSKALLGQLAEGQSVEIAGYVLPPAVALPMEQVKLDLTAPCSSVTWLEVSAAEPAAISPVGLDRIYAWRRAGINVKAIAVAGSQFWQTQEIEECPALIEATLTALCDAPA